MFTRREILKQAAGIAGVASFPRLAAEALASAPLPRTPIDFKVPAGACDCHTHIFDPGHFSYAASRPYTPETANVNDVRALQRALHMDRVIISQPTVYGTDHTCTLDAIKQLGNRARGVGFISENITDAEMDRLHAGGIRGVVVHGIGNLSSAAARIKGRGWSIETFVRPADLDGIKDKIISADVPIVLTLFGGAKAALGVHQPGFDTLLGLLGSGKVYVDLSDPNRASDRAPDFPDVAPIAKALIAANPERITWGTDWPHATATPGLQPSGLDPVDDGLSLNLLHSWTSGADQLKRILVDNPARLYGF